MRRRHFLTLSGSTLGGALLRGFEPGSGAGAAKKLRIPLRFFTEQEAAVVAAATARIFPSDESGPGAAEAGVVVYIDRQLAGPWGRDRYRYTQPPFARGVPEQGYQGAATPRQVYRGSLRLLAGFEKLTPAQQDAKLRAIEDTRFFQTLRRNTIEGMFCDPMHGGNAGLAGWKLIGFPGPYMSWAEEFGQYQGTAFRPEPKSLSDVLGRPVKPWEDIES
jgi:gluconate 2-dehydrogenase gamma chain